MIKTNMEDITSEMETAKCIAQNPEEIKKLGKYRCTILILFKLNNYLYLCLDVGTYKLKLIDQTFAKNAGFQEILPD